MKLNFRISNFSDLDNITYLYKNVAKINGGLARVEEEFSNDFVKQNLFNSLKNGECFVAIINNNNIIAEIHCYKLEPKVFNHLLSNLTIVVHPDFQGKGIGKKLFKTLLDKIENERPDILRVELIVRESNFKAINMYKDLGFVIEGKFNKRINNNSNEFEADIPMAWFNVNYVDKYN